MSKLTAGTRTATNIISDIWGGKELRPNRVGAFTFKGTKNECADPIRPKLIFYFFACIIEENVFK